ncbi:MAG: aldehyde dehydrogenase family protein [Pseudomonadota bacterium]
MSERLAVRNPRSGAADYEIPRFGSAEIAPLAERMRTAQKKWLAAGVTHRVSVLQDFVAALHRHQQDIIAALSADTGRHRLAQGEFFGVVGAIERWCQQAPVLLETKDTPSMAMPDVMIGQQLDPFPLLGAISPWNFPMLLSFIDATPALLAGSAVIIKPSEVTPRFAAPIVEAIASVPALNEVLAIISGDGATGAALIDVVDAVAFTGSVATGKKVAVAAAQRLIPAFLELGGKDPAIVLPGSDIDRATTAILRASVAATGQACQSLERVYVHDSQYDDFVTTLTAKAEAVPLSFPDPHEGTIGPLIFARQAEIIAAHLADAVAKGATVRCGGEVQQLDGGCYVEPTVLSHVDHSMTVMTEETFGPIMPVMRYSEVDEAVTLANDSIYGLSAAVFGQDMATARDVAHRLNAGGVSVNDAGMTTMIFEAEKSAYGASGLGASRMGASGLLRFLRRKALYQNHGATVAIDSMRETGIEQ